jgi:hypothetical protein
VAADLPHVKLNSTLIPRTADLVFQILGVAGFETKISSSRTRVERDDQY